MPGPEVLPYNGGVENRAEEFEPRPFENTIVAVDVDGVLVRPNAYRLAVGLTISFFAEQLGVDPKPFMVDDRNRTPGRNMNHFEAEGIHDPWDVSAIIVSLMKLKKAGIDVSNGEALEAFRTNSDSQRHPPEVILEWIIETYKRDISVKDIKSISGTLSRTRDPFRNEITSVFQEYVLGGETFESTYGKRCRTGADESLIETRDQSLISGEGRKDLDEITKLGGMVIVYTGRPGLPPYDAKTRPDDGYAPEAELAVEKSRVNALGIVSMGSMEWLARRVKSSVESLTKPNPTQALSAILAGLRGRVDTRVLLDAHKWIQTGEAPDELQPFIGKVGKKLELVVIEDSPSGIRAFSNAGKVLRGGNINFGLTAIGVHDRNYDEKHVAFTRLTQEEGISTETFADINPGINRILFSGRDRFAMGEG